MKRFAKKPAILKKKIELAQKLRQLPSFLKKDNCNNGFYWHGQAEINGKRIDVYFQKYVARPGVDYVRLHWMPNYKALTTKEINDLLNKLKSQ